MITLTRLSGTVFALNADLIERVDATPDTVVTLVDGKKYVVTDTLDEVISAVRRYRGEIIALSQVVRVEPFAEAPEEPRRFGTVTELADVVRKTSGSTES
ncbi:MAG: flagellar FlbD family protein [Nocardioides sp.]